MNIYFLIAGVENKYFFLENWNVRELMSSRVKRVVSSWVDPSPWVQLYQDPSCAQTYSGSVLCRDLAKAWPMQCIDSVANFQHE